MHIYDDMFSKYNVTVAQILLTRATLTNERLPHVQNTIGRLLEMGVIPIVNENDTVAIDELELEIGENDSLSATVAAAVGADLLIILSDINGLYSADPAPMPMHRSFGKSGKSMPALNKWQAVPVRHWAAAAWQPRSMLQKLPPKPAWIWSS